MDRELIKSKLADAYIAGLRWIDIAAKHPEATEILFNEVAAGVEAELESSSNQLRPQEYYRGVGIEADAHREGLLGSIVYRDCPAANLGVKAGDIVTKINFQSINNMDLYSALQLLRNSDYEGGIILEVRRKEEVMTLGYGLNAKPKVIDAKQKYLLNFTALTIGRRLRQLQGVVNVDLNSKTLVKKRDFAMSL